MVYSQRYITPFILPIAAFAVTIVFGGVLLSMDFCSKNGAPAVVDAFFTATSAVCVTGLATIDLFNHYNLFGQWIIMLLVQAGGLGILTYTTLLFYLLRKRISLNNRLAVEQGLFYDPTFNLGKFIIRIISIVIFLELLGAITLILLRPTSISPFEALFLAISAFCNAGFSPWVDSLVRWQTDWAILVTIMLLIISGGIGFFVLNELLEKGKECANCMMNGTFDKTMLLSGRLSFYSNIVLKTTLLLLLFGALGLFLIEIYNPVWGQHSIIDILLTALFQSVTSRTAGFATIDLAHFSDLSLLLLIFLMFIGGSPGSTAGGIKITAFRVLAGNLLSQLRGRDQIIVGGRAVSSVIVNKVMLLFYYGILIIIIATFLLMLTENGITDHTAGRLHFFDLFFEVVSAFATVGLSINITPLLSSSGKIILCVLMFIGKVGLIWLVTTIQQFQTEISYKYPEDSLPVG